LESPGGDARHLRTLYDLTLDRTPRPQESDLLLRALSRYRRTYGIDPTSAQNLLKVGDTPVTKSVPTAEQAAWMIVASTLMNTDEFLTQH
jgi:hypothetical protein